MFGDSVGVDVLETMDSQRRRYQCFNIVDLATGFQQLELLREVTKETHGPPSAEMCLEAFQRWLAWAGLPKVMWMDRGTLNHGAFVSYLTEKGVDVRFAATEAPHMLGKVERRGGLAKAVIRKTAAGVRTVGPEALRSVIQESIAVKNSTMNVSGFKPTH